MNFGILGAGSWGIAFGNLLRDNSQNVLIWGRRKEYVNEVNQTKRTPYLKNIRVNVPLTHDLNEFLNFTDILVIAVPVQFIREVFEKIKQFEHKIFLILNLSKGIEIKTQKRVSEIVSEFFNVPYSVLSGPSHAEEVASKIPTAVTLAGEHYEFLQKIISNDYFRVYISNDVVGVEIAGALKNVMAIAAGILDGLGGWDNSKAALMTRALYEMIKFGQYFGAKKETFFGLAGVGDLMVTCNSKHSRNRKLGELIVKEKDLSKILTNSKMVAEGMYTVKAVVDFSKKVGIEMPISNEVYEILYNGKDPKLSMLELMNRPLKNEWYI
ncbi:NAD(P)H-dependent glycerol-3-phosphate dehydrogenase [Thermosipho atlanticus]|uniref:Glycerol-3-phosphate dehydrogenase [NAD(P)+] n=1 Tax=Thermosipho atlanticus DSM 15807 TaxID=1123380 RepID=A0A1M5SPZ3_9BACT|nr:NAD(P)H-dependent glycerol-3-phosphate dehydrogenase [Thermosipho atlanticus]SHH40581.1 glycerol 3-phosphate dehydrogenase (NAD(P)+) [Thermosipho atlanticus DSM 15807]